MLSTCHKLCSLLLLIVILVISVLFMVEVTQHGHKPKAGVASHSFTWTVLARMG
jgi:competence protein ComGC